MTTPALSATTEAAVVEKPTLSDEEVAKLAAEASKKDEKASETATTEKTEAVDKEKAKATETSTDKKTDKAVDEEADKKDENKAENPITATKNLLEQLTSEAEVLNTIASNFANKKSEDKAGKEAIASNEDTITVNKTRGVQGAGFTTITYADGLGRDYTVDGVLYAKGTKIK